MHSESAQTFITIKEIAMYKVTLTQIIEKMELKNLLPDIDTDSINVNRIF